MCNHMLVNYEKYRHDQLSAKYKKDRSPKQRKQSTQVLRWLLHVGSSPDMRAAISAKKEVLALVDL